jgi:carbon storage regulator CsrA
MLVLTRKEGDIIQIGPNITVQIVRIKHGPSCKVVIGIEAPDSIAITRPDAVLTAPLARQPHLPNHR